ncbi:MAG: hypothetical protein KGV59_07610 [Tenacibaculum sp.]|nr:hypothetical protein [Tenacibaculum sp.]
MKTHEILQMSASDFDVVMCQAFTEWAMLRTNYNKKMAQKLITYKPLAKWFAVEFSKRCDEFKTAFKPYLNSNEMDLKTRIKFFWNMVDGVFHIYPSVLMNSFMKKNKAEAKV